MVKTKSAPVLNTHKLTEYFGKCSGPSSSQPQATPPAPSSQASRTSAPRSSVKAKMSSLTPTQAPFQSSSKMGSRQLTLLLQRPGKKENAPPPRSRPQDPEVISISSASDSQTHISISTDAATHISISSTSAISLGSSVVEINAPDHAHLKVKQERQCLGTVSIPSSPARSRRSPRLQLKGESSNGTVKRETSWDPSLVNDIKPTLQINSENCLPKKRKRITSDDEEVNLDDAKDVVYVIPKSFQSSAKADAVTPTHSPTKPQTPSSRKRTRLIEDLPAHDGAADDEEVIPSSQSDERDELSLTRPPRKFHKEIYESVRAWRANSQPDTSLETDDNGWIADKVGQGSDSHIDADIGLDFGSPFHSPAPRTPVSANCKRDAPLEDVQGGSEQPSATTIPDHHFTSNFSATPPPDRFSTATPFLNSSLSRPLENEQPRMPTCSSPVRRYQDPISDSQPVLSATKIMTNSKHSSPHLSSSASSLTKVDLPIHKQPPSPKRMPIPEVEIPLALDSNLKTAEFIANIRANAFAAMSSPDDDEKVAQELSSLSESDSELESEPLNFFCLAKSKGPVTKTSQVSMSTDFTALGQIFSSPLTDIDEVDRRTRHSKRNLPSPTPSSSRTRRVPNKRPSILTIPPPPRKKRPTDPFSKLLKEKAEEEKFAPLRKSLLDFTLDLTDEDDEDENSASVSKRKRRLGSLHTSDEGDIDNVVDETARTRLLGMDDDGKLGRIIDDDRAENGKGKEKGSILGVPFFKTASDADMEIDRSEFVFPSLEGISEDPLMDLLKSCVDAKDTNGAAVVLGCSVFSMPSFSLSCGFLSWLFEVSLFSQGHLARSSSNLLHHICETHPSAKETFVSVSPILKALVWLGARKDVLDTIGFDDLPCNTHGNAPYQSEVLWRLSRLINLFGKNKMLDPTVVPSCVSLMIAIGMDVQTDFDLKLSITAAINTLIIGYCSRFTMERGEMELSICSRILPLTANLSPANREYLLTFINGVSRTARRIAQWIGFAMLTDDFGAQLASEYVDGPPALSYVIALLNPGSTDESQPGLFDLRRSAEQGDDFDYVALGHHIEVLAHVLMNIAEYVQLEQLEGGPTPAGSFSGVTSDNDSPSKSKSTSEKSKLEAIRMLLERLGNKIVDTRAAHLDRSQTKASILRLTMRMRYQCLASRGKSEKGKDGKLETFWPKA